ncbi:MAG: hypothetical protein AAF245_13090, partial [Pseudomonadota bacterium]
LLPDFILNSEGTAGVVHIDQGWWTVQQADLVPNTIYVVNHGLQFAPGVDASNIAMIANGPIGAGPGPATQFDRVFLYGTGALDFAGEVTWGNAGAYCGEGTFRAYLFSQSSLRLAGSGTGTGAYGVIGAAPRFLPGSALERAGGLYIEASQSTNLGGNMNIAGCSDALTGELAMTGFPSEGGGSYLVH